MMSICLAKLLTADAQARLLTCENEYTFDRVEYAPLMCKIIMRLATIDYIHHPNPNPAQQPAVPTSIRGNSDKVHKEFDKKYSHLIARGMTVGNPISILF